MTSLILFIFSFILPIHLDMPLSNVQESNQTRLIVDHSAWNSILQKYVQENGRVNYATLRKDRRILDTYLKFLSQNHPDASWSREEQMAFWINAYNAYTIVLILDNYPLSSITQLEGGKVWDKKWITIGNKRYSLNNIENDILRPQFQDPRIHFAVNCAAKSCPPLHNRAFTASNLDTLLDKQTKAFINDETYNKITKKAVTVSKIFDWYAEDFSDLIGYLNEYSNTAIQSNAAIKFTEYDWSLNE